jgi:phosphopantothenoylcysteine decarboxylase/phosphopantothenate--cysteine ligase
VLGVCGSIAAYKAADLCSRLVQAGFGVTAVMTQAAQKLVGPLTFEALTGRSVVLDPFTREPGAYVEHIQLADRAHLLVVAPATGNFLGKAAHGIADDVLTSAYLAMTCPVLVAPAMNVRMWEHPAVRRNVATLLRDGVHVVEPDAGFLACRDVGKGRLAPPQAILARIEALVGGRAAGKR